jgi:Electron transfer DM13
MTMRSFIASHRLVLSSAAVVVVALIAFVLIYFEPQTLFIDDRVDEPLPTVTSSDAGSTTPSTPSNGGGQSGQGHSGPALEVLASGPFSSYEHSTTGRARVIRLGDGSRYLRFDHFETSNGPDVRVYLSAAPAGGPGDAFDDDYVELGELKGNIGDQNYAIPGDLRLSDFQSAVVWCKRFSVPFGAAPV